MLRRERRSPAAFITLKKEFSEFFDDKEVNRFTRGQDLFFIVFGCARLGLGSNRACRDGNFHERKLAAHGNCSGRLHVSFRHACASASSLNTSGVQFSVSACRIKSCWLLGAMPPIGGSRSRLVGKE